MDDKQLLRDISEKHGLGYDDGRIASILGKYEGETPTLLADLSEKYDLGYDDDRISKIIGLYSDPEPAPISKPQRFLTGDAPQDAPENLTPDQHQAVQAVKDKEDLPTRFQALKTAGKQLLPLAGDAFDFLTDQAPRAVASAVGNFVLDIAESSNFDVSSERESLNKALSEELPVTVGGTDLASNMRALGVLIENSPTTKRIEAENVKLQEGISKKFDGKGVIDLMGEGRVSDAAGKLSFDVVQAIPGFAAVIATGGVGIVGLAAGTAGQTTDDLIDAGVDPQTATFAGGAAGSAEIIFESIGLKGINISKKLLKGELREKLLGISKTSAASIIGAGATEGGTEALTGLSQALIEDIAKDDFPKDRGEFFDRYVKEPIEQGLVGIALGGGLRAPAELINKIRTDNFKAVDETTSNQQEGQAVVETPTGIQGETPTTDGQGDSVRPEVDNDGLGADVIPVTGSASVAQDNRPAEITNEPNVDEAQEAESVTAESEEAEVPARQEIDSFTDNRIEERRNTEDLTEAELRALALKDGSSEQRGAFTDAQIQKRRDADDHTPEEADFFDRLEESQLRDSESKENEDLEFFGFLDATPEETIRKIEEGIEVNKAINKGKNGPKGERFGLFTENPQLRESLAILNEYKDDNVSQEKAETDFKDAFFASPWINIEDAIKLREAARISEQNGVTFEDLLVKIQEEFEADGFNESSAADSINYRLSKIKARRDQFSKSSKVGNRPGEIISQKQRDEFTQIQIGLQPAGDIRGARDSVSISEAESLANEGGIEPNSNDGFFSNLGEDIDLRTDEVTVSDGSNRVSSASKRLRQEVLGDTRSEAAEVAEGVRKKRIPIKDAITYLAKLADEGGYPLWRFRVIELLNNKIKTNRFNRKSLEPHATSGVLNDIKARLSQDPNGGTKIDAAINEIINETDGVDVNEEDVTNFLIDNLTGNTFRGTIESELDFLANVDSANTQRQLDASVDEEMSKFDDQDYEILFNEKDGILTPYREGGVYDTDSLAKDIESGKFKIPERYQTFINSIAIGPQKVKINRKSKRSVPGNDSGGSKKTTTGSTTTGSGPPVTPTTGPPPTTPASSGSVVTGGKKQSQFETNSLPKMKDLDDAKGAVDSIKKKSPNFFNQIKIKESADKIAKDIDNKGGITAEATRLTDTDYTKNISLPELQLRRQIVLAGLGKMFNDAVKRKDQAAIDRIGEITDSIENSLAKDANIAGKASAVLAWWSMMVDPEGEVMMIRRKIQKAAASKVNAAGANNKTVGQNVEDLTNALSEEFGLRQDEIKAALKKASESKGKKSPKQVRKEAFDSISDVLDQWRNLGAADLPSLEAARKQIKENKQLAKAVKDIILSYIREGAGNVKDILEKSAERLGINKAIAREMVDAVAETFDIDAEIAKQKKKVGPAAKKALRKSIKNLVDKHIADPKEAKKVTEAALNAFISSDTDKPKIKESINKALKIPQITPEALADIQERFDVIKASPDGAVSKRRYTEILDIVANIGGEDSIDVITSFWHASVLSGPPTWNAVVFGNLANAIGVIYKIPSIEIGSNGVSTNFKAGSVGIRAMVNEITFAAIDAGRMLRSGQGFRDMDKIIPSKTLERIANRKLTDLSRAEKATTRAANLYKYVARIMNALDAVFFYPTSAFEAARSAYLSAQEAGLKGQELDNFVKSAISKSKESRTELKNQARQELEQSAKTLEKPFDELYDELDVIYRAREIYQERISKYDPEVVEKGVAYGREVALQNDPTGFIGAGLMSVSGFLKNVNTDFETTRNKKVDKALKGALGLTKLFGSTLFPYMRTAANMFNLSLDYAPIIGVVNRLNPVGKYRDPIFEDRGKRSVLVMKQLVGISLTAALLMSYDEEDDFITANGPSDFKKRSQLFNRGWQPYTIKIGDTRVSYKDWPIAPILMAVGAAHDNQRYEDGDNPTYMSLMKELAFGYGHYALNNSMMKTLGDITGASAFKTKEEALPIKAIEAIALRPIAGFTNPGFAKYLEGLIDPSLKDKNTFKDQYMGKVKGRAISMIPIARNMMLDDRYNYRGERIKKKEATDLWVKGVGLDRMFNDATPTNKLDKLMAEKDVFLKGISGNQMLLGEKMTYKERVRFSVVMGRVINRRMNQNFSNLKKMSPEDMQEEVDGYARLGADYAESIVSEFQNKLGSLTDARIEKEVRKRVN
jgi:hypothetical protein